MNLPLNIDFQQILLHFFNFGILFAGLYFILYKPVKDFMDKRKAHYTQMDEAADKVMEKAQAFKAEYEGKLSSVDEEIRQKRAEADKRAAAEGDAIVEDAKKQAARIVDEGRAQAESQRARIIESAREDIVKLAAEAAEKVVAKALDGADGSEASSNEQ